MTTHCGFSSLFHWANGLAPVQYHHASLLTIVKTLRCHVCNTVPGCEVFLFMLANDAHVGAISLITTSVKTLVGPSPLHYPPHSTTPGEWILVGWRLDWSVLYAGSCMHHRIFSANIGDRFATSTAWSQVWFVNVLGLCISWNENICPLMVTIIITIMAVYYDRSPANTVRNEYVIVASKRRFGVDT